MLPHFELNVTVVRDAEGRLTSVSKAFFFFYIYSHVSIHIHHIISLSQVRGPLKSRKEQLRPRVIAPGSGLQGRDRRSLKELFPLLQSLDPLLERK